MLPDCFALGKRPVLGLVVVVGGPRVRGVVVGEEDDGDDEEGRQREQQDGKLKRLHVAGRQEQDGGVVVSNDWQ